MFQPSTARTFSIQIDAPASPVFECVGDLRNTLPWSIKKIVEAS